MDNSKKIIIFACLKNVLFMETFALTLTGICLLGLAFHFGRYVGIKETLDELKNNKKK